MIRDAVLLGGGGHGRVVRALAEALQLRVIGVCDPALVPGADWHGVPVLGGDAALHDLDPASVVVLNGVGKLPGAGARARLQADAAARGFAFPVLVHPAAWVAPDARLAAGVQVMAGAVVQPGCRIGAGSIINTRAGVDHDCDLGADVHVAPGATLCGGVTLQDGAFVGAGAVVAPGLRIGADAVLAAGAVLVRDLGAGETALGPGAARPRDRKEGA